MNNLFRNADSFDQPLNNWDISSVINLDATFKDNDDLIKIFLVGIQVVLADERDIFE